MVDLTTESIRSGSYNFLNFIIFLSLYIFIAFYHYRLNTPASYFISMIIDILFSIYLINFSNQNLLQYDTLISSLILITIFGFVVLRLISSIYFSFAFLNVERKRKENQCKWSNIPKRITHFIDMNKMSYLYSSVGILLLLFMILFWGDKINDNIEYAKGNGMDKKAMVAFFLLAIIITFSIMNCYYSLKLRAVIPKTIICPSKKTKTAEQTYYDEYYADYN